MIRCDMNGLPFKHESLDIPDAEIAKVCTEISTNYSKYDGKANIMHRTRDLDGVWSIYFVENRGYGDYNIAEKYDDY